MRISGPNDRLKAQRAARNRPARPLSDVDLSARLRQPERDRPPSPAARAGSESQRRSPAVRTGGRIRMDVAASTRSGPRRTPIPAPPPYRRNSRPANLRAPLLWGLVALAVVAAVVACTTSRTFAIRRVEFEGVSAQTAAGLTSDMSVSPIGRNIFRYIAAYHGLVRRQMAAARPDFSSAAVSFRLPHTLIVRIYSRHPFALLSVQTGATSSQWILDARGVPIRSGAGVQAGPAGDYGAPEIRLVCAPAAAAPPVSADALTSPAVLTQPEPAPSAPESPQIRLGQPLPEPAASEVAEALAVIGALRAQPRLGNVSSISVDNSRDVGLNMANHLRVKLGEPSQLQTKLALVASLLAQHPELAREAVYLDVTYPPRPAMKPSQQEGEALAGGSD